MALWSIASRRGNSVFGVSRTVLALLVHCESVHDAWVTHEAGPALRFVLLH